MANDYEIMFRLEAEYGNKYLSSFGNAAESIKKLTQKTAEFNKVSKDVAGMVRATDKAIDARNACDKYKKSIAELENNIAKLKSPSKFMLQGLAQQKAKLNEAQTEMRRNMEVVRETRKELSKYGTTLKELVQIQNRMERSSKQLEIAQDNLAKVSAQRQRVDGVLRRNGDAAVASIMMLQSVGRIAARSLSAPISSAMQMQDAMADINKVVSFDDPNGLAKMQTELEKMSLSIPMTAAGLAQIAAAAGQSGVAANELVVFTEQAAKMGVAFDISAEEAGEMMAKWRSGMGLTQEKTVALADAVNALSNANAAQAKQIGETLKRYGALGKVVGLDEKQTAALAATVIGAGAEAEVAATGINAFMRALTKGGSMTDLQASAFQNIGLDPMLLQKQIQKDAPKAIMDVLNSIKLKVPKELQMQYLTAMFGEEGARAMGPMLSNTELLAKNFELVAKSANYTGSMFGEFKARIQTTSNALDLAKNAVDYVSGALGTPLLNPLRELLLRFVGISQVVGDWINKNQELVTKGMAAGIAVAGLVAGFHLLRIGVAFTVAPVLALYKGVLFLRQVMILSKASILAWTATTTMAGAVAKGFSIALKAVGVAAKFAFANPIGFAITAVAGLVAAGIYLYKNWDTVKVHLATAGEAIGNAFSKALEFCKGPINGIIGLINQVIAGINGLTSFKVPDWVPGLGGKSFGTNIQSIPQLANGGIATGPTLAMVGEGREHEAIIPLSKLPGIGGSPSINVTFSPVINVSGGGGDPYESVKRGLTDGSRALKRNLEQLLADQRRLSFA